MSKYCNTRDCIESQDISEAAPCQLCIHKCESGKVSMHISEGDEFCVRCEHCGFSSQMFGGDWVWHYKENETKYARFYEELEQKVGESVESWNMIQKLIAKSLNK